MRRGLMRMTAFFLAPVAVVLFTGCTTRKVVASVPVDASTECTDAGCVCNPPLVDCGGECVDLASHSDHCGECDNPCLTGGACVDRNCRCPTGMVVCDSVCADLSSDPLRCGDCDNPCDPLEECTSGQCVCGQGGTDCSGECADLETDSERCGDCNNPCDPTQYCVSGDCLCRPGLTDCFGECVDRMSDPLHCGTCGNDCDGGNGDFCFQGLCTFTACDQQSPPAEACGTDNEACVTADSMQSNPLHCGECNRACEAGEVCANGHCTDYYAAAGCATCPCPLCGGALCCTYPGDSLIICVRDAQQCP